VRCRKAHWFLSAQCDDTLSEKRRRELAAHLEECASCRRETFYFSEIKGQTARIEKVRARADFNLRLKARIRAWEAEQEEVRSFRPSIWSVVFAYPSRLRSLLADAGSILLGQRRFALVGVLSVLLIAVIWAGYRADNTLIENESAFMQDAAGFSNWQGAGDFYLAGMPETTGQSQSYLVSGISLTDDISPRAQPYYVMPTIPAEQVNARVIF